MHEAAYILAGGRSSRFGSDKARAALGGVPLVQRVARALGGQAVVVAADPGAYADLGLTTITDAPAHRRMGPLAGLAAALRHRLTHHGVGWTFVATCDWLDPCAPGAPPTDPQLQASVTVDDAGQLQPFPGWYHTAALPAVEAALDSDRRSVCRLLETLPIERVHAPAPQQANTRDALEAFATSRSTVRLPVLRGETPRLSVSTPDTRTIGYLRLSLTRACAMRCVYCRPGFDTNPVGERRLSPAQLGDVVRHLAQSRGLTKVRLTGGDPTSRPELLDILRRVAAAPGITDVAMTTNGLTLARHAPAYADAGLRRVNLSLDTLDAERFRQLTGVTGLKQVLRGLDAARAAGLGVKLNTVVVRGSNLDDLPSMLGFAADRGVPLRLIELMPMGPLADAWADRYVPEAGMRAVLDPHIRAYDPVPQGRSAARSYRVTLRDGRAAELGFITPMSCNFCADCDRLRLDAAGRIYPCLMDAPRGDLDAAWSADGAFDPAAFETALADAYAAKAPEHPALGVGTMTHIGG